jgi:periplasmic protein TonB
MSLQSKSIQLSFLIHALVFALIMTGNTLIPKMQRPISINFDIDNSKDEGSPPAPSPPKAENKPVRQMVKAPVKEVVQKNEPLPEKPIEDIQRIDPSPAEITLPVNNTGIDKSKEISGGTVGGSGDGSGMGGIGSGSGSGGSGEKAKMKYLKEHFAYIRDKILRNVSYPPVALRMGWQGKTAVSFIICSDGSVKRVEISKSSGFKVLDENAVDTVQNSAPFPRPPIEAQITVPITYRMN